MSKKTLSLLLVTIICFLEFNFPVHAETVITDVNYADGAITISGTGFSPGVTYIIRILDVVNNSVKAMGDATADFDGHVNTTVITGTLQNIGNYVVRVNHPDGTMVASGSAKNGSKPTPVATPSPTPTVTSVVTPTATPVVTPSATQRPAATSTPSVAYGNGVEMKGNIDNTGKVIATASKTIIDQAVKDAVAAVEFNSQTTGAAVEIGIDAPQGTREVALELPKDAFLSIADSTVNMLVVTTAVCNISIDKKTMDAIKKSLIAKENDTLVNISVAVVDTQAVLNEYSDASKVSFEEKIGDRPVYNFNLMAGEKKISDFMGGTVNVKLPYNRKAGEDQNAILIYYLDEMGHLKIVPDCKYDAHGKTVEFKTKHFSRYAIGYNKKVFTDVYSNSWYNTAVSFAAARGIVGGVGGNLFAPEDKITRADFLIMVMNAYGIGIDNAFESNFADAGDTYYTKYLATAKKMGFVSGTGNNRYEPENNISRQDMFVIIYHILERLGELPENTSDKTLGDYKDAGEIAEYAHKAMKKFVDSGVIAGRYDRLAPADSTTRAETVQVLYNLLSK